MKKIKTIASWVLGWTAVVYVGFFFVWAMLVLACAQEHERGCSSDIMSQTVRIAYAPFLKLLK